MQTKEQNKRYLERYNQKANERKLLIAAKRLDDYYNDNADTIKRWLRFGTIYQGDDQVIKIWKLRMENYLTIKENI